MHARRGLPQPINREGGILQSAVGVQRLASDQSTLPARVINPAVWLPTDALAAFPQPHALENQSPSAHLAKRRDARSMLCD